MSEKHKHKNQYGSFAVRKSQYKKYLQFFVTALIVVIFIFAGKIIWSDKHKPTKIADTQVVDKVPDQIPGWWYQQYFGKDICDQPACDQKADPDHDGLTNYQEFYYHTNPLNAYTVQDKLNDGELVAAGFDPSKPGHMTFDQVSTPENLLGESLLFDSDIKKMVADANDINQVVLPLVADDNLHIIDDSPQNFKTYATALQTAVDKYFPAQSSANIAATLKSGSDDQVVDIKLKSDLLVSDLKNIPVPKTYLMFTKYNIAMFQLLGKVVPIPSDLSGTAGDTWYENAREFFAVQQKLQTEQQRLKLLLQ